MYPFNHSHRSFGWSLSLCSLLHIVGSFAKFQTGNGNEIVVVGILIDDKQPRDGRESSRIESSRIDSLVETEGNEELSPEETKPDELSPFPFLLFLFSSLRIKYH